MPRKNEGLDKIDEDILKILENNSKLSVTKIAEKLGIDRKVCERKIQRLVKDKVILKYTILYSKESNADKTSVYVFIKLKRSNTKNMLEIKNFVKRHPCIRSAGKIAGDWDFFIFTRHSTKTELANIMDDIGTIKSVAQTRSFLVMEDLLA